MAMRNAFDDAVETESTKVISHPPDGIVGWIESQQLRQKGTHFLIVEPTQLETEDDQDGEQGLHPLVAEPQCRSALSVYFDGTDYLIKGVFADRAIMGNLLDVQKTPVGLEADLPQSRQVLQ